MRATRRSSTQAPGNLFNNGFFNPTGVYRSVDAGQTWTNVAKSVFGSRGINRMTSPSANVLLVATNNGLFKSIDGGTNFGTAPSFTNGSPVLNGSISDLHLDTTTANSVFAAVNGSGIFQSTDGGSTWGANLFTEHQRRADCELQLHLLLAVDQPEQPDHLRQRRRRHRLPVDRAAAERLQLQQPLRLHRRRRELDRAGHRRRVGLRGRGPDASAATTRRSASIPADANKVYIGFQRLLYSSNGGAGPFNAVSDNKIHWDEHAIVFSPSTHPSLGPETRVWVGNDGGVARSDNAGGTWDNLNENGQHQPLPRARHRPRLPDQQHLRLHRHPGHRHDRAPARRRRP